MKVDALFAVEVVTIMALSSSGLLIGCGSTEETSKAEVGPLRVSGGGIGQFREAGADNSIEQYGHEASREEMKQAAKVVHGYLVARVDSDWRVACSFASEELKERVRKILEFAEKAANPDCPHAMAALAQGEPPVADTRYRSTVVNAGSLRVKGDYGFLFFNAGEEGRKLIMTRQIGRWKVGGLLPTPLH